MFNDRKIEDYSDYDTSVMLGFVKPANINFQSIINDLDCHKDFYGVGIIYNDGVESFVIRESRPGAGAVAHKITHVIITKILTSLPDSVKKKFEDIVTSSLIENEKTSFMLSCGAMILWGIGTFIADAATVASFGGATPLAVISTAGTIATGAQCVNSGLRLYDLNFQDGKWVRWFDSQTWYLSTIAILDLIALAGAGRDLYKAVKAFRAIKSVSTNATVSLIKWLRGFNVTERITLSKNIIKHFNPNASAKQISMWLTANRYPKVLDYENAMREINSYLNDTIISSMGYGGSALNGILSGAPFVAKKQEPEYREQDCYAIGILRTEQTF